MHKCNHGSIATTCENEVVSAVQLYHTIWPSNFTPKQLFIGGNGGI